MTPTLGGRRVRVRLSNRFGQRPVTFASAFIARRATQANLVPRSARRLRFARRRSITVPAGGEVVSDAVALRFAAFEDLAVSVHLAGATGPASSHVFAPQTSYASVPGDGDRAGDESGTAFREPLAAWPFVADVEVRAPRRIGAVIAVGDSITDGVGSAGGARRYPDVLSRRLAAAGRPFEAAVQNAGISGNKVLSDGDVPILGPALLARLDADVIDQAGARVVIVLEGTNDLGADPPATADAVIGGLVTIVGRLRAAGLRVLLGTQTPAGGTRFRHGTSEAIAARNRINDWIRANAVADGVVDFHAALRDPNDPDRLRPEYDSGDHLHPNGAGYEAMAGAVDLNLLRGKRCGRR